MPEETFEVTVKFGNSLLQYLGGQPYQEVAGLIQELQHSAQAGMVKAQAAQLPTDINNESVEENK